MVASRKAPTKEESQRLSEEGDKIKFTDLRFERRRLLDSGKREEGKTLHKLHVLGMNDDLWGRVYRLGSESWNGCV